ncbi:hypothetical protein CEXT_669591 [Caerostris extrusa]|uniref:Uncharacterized protein n=1 Tax=Caerostris extrusa TaxID=172846 RepID=A0AAV4Y121_CAEEX|nr:hypothetical protein CEXT_669591 [Caerostris extrusa]
MLVLILGLNNFSSFRLASDNKNLSITGEFPPVMHDVRNRIIYSSRVLLLLLFPKQIYTSGPLTRKGYFKKEPELQWILMIMPSSVRHMGNHTFRTIHPVRLFEPNVRTYHPVVYQAHL